MVLQPPMFVVPQYPSARIYPGVVEPVLGNHSMTSDFDGSYKTGGTSNSRHNTGNANCRVDGESVHEQRGVILWSLSINIAIFSKDFLLTFHTYYLVTRHAAAPDRPLSLLSCKKFFRFGISILQPSALSR